MQYIKCPLCNAESYKVLAVFNNDRCLKALNRSACENRKVMCNKCGLVYENPRLDEDEIRKLYIKLARSTELGYTSTEPSEEYLYWKDLKAKADLEWLQNYIPFHIENRKVLDIGCAEGSLLRLFKEKNYEVVGVEPTLSYAEFGRREYNLNIINNFFEYTDFPKSSFDLVSVLKVLEHCRDPINFLKSIKDILKDDGFIYIEVPNIYKPRLDFTEFIGAHHLILFSPQTLTALLTKTGFKVIRLDGLALSLRAIAKKKDTYDTEDDKGTDLIVNRDNYSQIVQILKRHRVKCFFFRQKNNFKLFIKKLLTIFIGKHRTQKMISFAKKITRQEEKKVN